MAHSIKGLNGVEAFFQKNASNQPVIQFQDPSYVRAETIVFDAKTGNVHAVLHENLHFVGQIPKELDNAFKNSKAVVLAAHHVGKPIEMTAQISIF